MSNCWIRKCPATNLNQFRILLKEIITNQNPGLNQQTTVVSNYHSLNGSTLSTDKDLIQGLGTLPPVYPVVNCLHSPVCRSLSLDDFWLVVCCQLKLVNRTDLVISGHSGKLWRSVVRFALINCSPYKLLGDFCKQYSTILHHKSS